MPIEVEDVYKYITFEVDLMEHKKGESGRKNSKITKLKTHRCTQKELEQDF